MKLSLLADRRVAILTSPATVVDVTAAVPFWSDDPLSDFFVQLCRDFAALRPDLEDLARRNPAIPLPDVRLRAPVLNPSKVIAAAMNYAEHRAEMEQRADGSGLAWRMEFDIF